MDKADFRFSNKIKLKKTGIVQVETERDRKCVYFQWGNIQVSSNIFLSVILKDCTEDKNLIELSFHSDTLFLSLHVGIGSCVINGPSIWF